MSQICFNGKLLKADEPVLLAANRSYRYGDGLFETIKVSGGKVLLEQLHFERLFSGLLILKYEIPKLFAEERIKNELLELCRENNVDKLARVRLSVFRGNGGLYDNDKKMQYLIECWPLSESSTQLNKNGLLIDVYPGARKSCDRFSNLKSANFLSYSMAALYAKEKKLNDCFVLNSEGNVADSTIANIFLIENGIIKTPALSQGCVAGVMRRHLLSILKDAGHTVQETSINEADLIRADEVFLTNAINGIRWVKQFRERVYANNKTIEIYNQFVKTIIT